MSYDDDDDDWDEYPDDEDDVGDLSNCPECGTKVYEQAESCPACGRWFLSEDRDVMHKKTHRQGENPESTAIGIIVKIVAVILAILILVSVLM